MDVLCCNIDYKRQSMYQNNLQLNSGYCFIGLNSSAIAAGYMQLARCCGHTGLLYMFSVCFLFVYFLFVCLFCVVLWAGDGGSEKRCVQSIVENISV
jgi:hypothetical protein